MRNMHLTTRKITKSLKNMNNVICTQWDLEYGENTENHGKCEIHTLGREICRGKLKIMENEKHPLDDLKNDEITKKREK